MSFSLYFSIVFIILLFLILKYWHNDIAVFIVLIFFHGFFAFYGKGVEDPYKIVIALYSIYLVHKYRLFSEIRQTDRRLMLAFALFTVGFLISAIVNSDGFVLVLSQYFSKYFIVLTCFFLFRKVLVRNDRLLVYSKLIVILIVIQVLLSVFKFYSQGLVEGVVGTISSKGGAVATTFPICVIFFIMISSQGKLQKRDWMILLCSLIISFSSMKRAIWFVFPFFLFITYYALNHNLVYKKLLLFMPLVPFIFYFGVKLNPTLNPENKVWGNFDVDYVLNYASDYSIGDEDKDDINDELAYGRVSSSVNLVIKIFSFNYSQTDIFGIGQEVVRSTNYDEFLEYKSGLGTKMALNGFYRTFLTTGILGVVAILFLFSQLVKYVGDKRFKVVLIIYLLWDYFLYHGNSFDSAEIMVFLMFIIWQVNNSFKSKVVLSN